MPNTKVYFVRDGQRLPFSAFLIREKQARKLTWKALGELCETPRISAYFYGMSDGLPNNPPHDKLRHIIHSLRYSEDDFEISGTLGRTEPLNPEEYTKLLRRLGDVILEQNRKNQASGRRPQKLSTSAVRHFVGDRFYHWYGHSYESMQKLHADLQILDPKYKGIELQHIEMSARAAPRRLQKFEEDIIETSLLEYLSTTGATPSDRLPKGTLIFVADALNKELEARRLPTRSVSSLSYHANRVWKNQTKRITLSRGSPTGSRERSTQQLDSEIDKLEEAISTEPELQNLAESIVDTDNTQKNRSNFYRYASVGHNNLVLFLMDLDNYKEHLGQELSLFAVDFPTSDVAEDLLTEFKERISLLEAESKEYPDEVEVVDFVAGWLRCDMIFRKRGGGFVVVEVKQYAIDKPDGFKNGTKACQQLSGYCAILLDNIIRHNLDNIAQPDYSPLKESVEGYLVAYEIDRYFLKHLNRAGNRRPIVVSKEEVNAYLVQPRK